MLLLHLIDEEKTTDLELYQIATVAASGGEYGPEHRVATVQQYRAAKGVADELTARAAILHFWCSPAPNASAPSISAPIVVSERRFHNGSKEPRPSGSYVFGEILTRDKEPKSRVGRDGSSLFALPLAAELPSPKARAASDSPRAPLGLRESGNVVGLVVIDEKSGRLAAAIVRQIRESCSSQQSEVEFILLGNREGAAAFRRVAAPNAERGVLTAPAAMAADLSAAEATIAAAASPAAEVNIVAATSLPPSLAAIDLLWVAEVNNLTAGYITAAARHNIPTVAVDSAAAREAVEHEVTGLLAPTDAPGESTRRIDRLIAAPFQRRALGNAAGAATRSSEEPVTPRLSRFYRELFLEAGLPGSAPHTGGEPLRIAMVTQEDPFYLPRFFKEFFRVGRLRRALVAGPSAEPAAESAAEPAVTRSFPAEGRPVEIRGVMVQRALGNKTKKGLAKRIYRLYGALGFARVGFRYLFAKIGAKVRPERTVAGSARAVGVPLLSMDDANGEAFLSFVGDEKIDLVVSVSASQIFKGEILEAPTYGCINLHNAPLPRYRGMLPNFWQMYHGEAESVLTIHQMVSDLDKGEILLRRATPISEEMSLEDLIQVTKIRSARALWELLDRFSTDSAETTPLPEDEGSYFSWPTREQSKEFRRRGRRLL